ncbi:MAG: amidohydrolase [Eubacterium sp.]|nr:amidohydrolase [Candidatus Colimonas fimequi]
MKADKLFLGNVITMEDEQLTAEAVAVADGKIIFVGSAEDAKDYVDENTVITDYGKNTIYPGFIESHCHSMLAGARINLQADLTEGESLQDYIDTLKKWMEDHPGRTNYQGAGWKLCDFEPHKSILDEICPDVPMFLNSFDGHSVWLNSAAIELCGFNQESVEEFGEELVRVDENGELTGYISEKPAIDITKAIAELMTPDVMLECLQAWQEFAFSQGITACQEAACSVGLVPVVAELFKSDKLKIRTGLSVLIDELTDTDVKAFVENVSGMVDLFDGAYAKINSIKAFVDGVIEAHTGWLLDEYLDEPGYYGIQRFSDPEAMKQLMMAAAEKNLFVHTHCIGDAATKCVVDGIEAARKEDGRYDQKNQIAHLQVVRPEDIKRMGELNVTAAVPPLWTPKTVAPVQDEIEIRSMGIDRFENAYPIKSFMDEGCMIVFHSDFPVSPEMSVPRSVYMAVTRKNPDNPEGEPRNGAECISRLDALKAMTVNAAIQLGDIDNIGTLAPGKVANMVVYNCDFMKDELDEVVAAQLQATIVDGDIVFEN